MLQLKQKLTIISWVNGKLKLLNWHLEQIVMGVCVSVIGLSNAAVTSGEKVIF